MLKSTLWWSLPLVLATAQVQAIGVGEILPLIADGTHANAPGCAVAAFRAGQPILSTSAGLADLKTGRAIDGSTLFYAASVSKQFTALAVAQLAVAGDIDLDGDVRTYIPELPEYTRTVTPRMLLHHTAGIADWLSLAAMSGAKDWGALDRAQALALVIARADTAFEPGTRFEYSNGGYLLLAEIVARTSGQSFAEYLRTHVFEPMGMRDAFFLDGARPDDAHVAHGYLPDGDGFVVRDTYPLIGGSGGLMLSADDLARYEYDIEIGHAVWTDAVRDIMLAPAHLRDGSAAGMPSGLGYAGGLRVGERNGQHVVEHGGAAEAFKLQYLRVPARRLAVAVLCNRGDWNPNPRADAIAALLEGDALWTGPAPMPERAGDYVDAGLDLHYRVGAVEGDRLPVRIVSPLTGEAGAVQWFKRGAQGVFVAEDPLRPVQIQFEPDAAALQLSIAGANTLRLLRSSD
ncbi:MAG: serine hydrolase domain-containing protein [Luteimonas sp.]